MGQTVAWLLVVVGFCMMFGIRVPYFGTGFVGGLWLVFIGWFLNGAALASYRQLVVQDILESAPVAQIMRTQFAVVPPDMSVARVVFDYLMGSDDRAFPVVDTTAGNRLLGLVCMHDVRRVPRDAWEHTNVTEVMTPAERLQVLRPSDDAADALRLMSQHNVGQAPVVEDGTLVGMVQRADIVRWLQSHADQGERRMAA